MTQSHVLIGLDILGLSRKNMVQGRVYDKEITFHI